MKYNELKISKENHNKEMESFEKIKKCIDEEKVGYSILAQEQVKHMHSLKH